MKNEIIAIAMLALIFVSGCRSELSGDKDIIGGDKDEHGCIPSAGYSWCEAKQKCIRQFEENCTAELVGNDADEHGCRISAGYSWCESKGKCLRPWEESCEQTAEQNATKITKEQAMENALGSECARKGELIDNAFYNENSKTWWIDLNMKPEFARDGCSPACVVYGNGTVEINWRCTGLIGP